MKYLIVAFILFCLLAFQNDKNQELETLVVSPDKTSKVNLSEIAESVQIVPLETNDSCLISFINCLDLCDNYIFISSGNGDFSSTIMQFDTKGKFIRKIGRLGKGPTRYLHPNNFTCDANNQRIYILDDKRILCFGFNGKYISTIKLNHSIDDITIIDNQLFTFYSRFEKKIGYKWINQVLADIYSLDGKLVDSLEIKNIEVDLNTKAMSPGLHYLSRAAGKDYFYYPVLLNEPITRDTLYQFSPDRQLIPRYKVDFERNSIGEIKKLLIANMFRTDRYLFTDYRYGRNPLFLCYDLKNNTQYNTAYGFYDDLHQIPNIILNSVQRTPNLVYAKKRANELSDMIDGIDENDNPVLMLVRLKE